MKKIKCNNKTNKLLFKSYVSKRYNYTEEAKYYTK